MSQLDDDRQTVVMDSICHYAQQCFAAIAEEQTAPHVVLRPTLSLDGDQWCALYGADLQAGVSGFGKSPHEAMRAFDVAYFAERKS